MVDIPGPETLTHGPNVLSHSPNTLSRRSRGNSPPGAPPARGMTRRDFLRACSLLTAAMALPLRYTRRVAEALSQSGRTPVIWLEFQDCAGDTESLLRASHPSAAELVLDLISLDYHETIMAPAGKNAEASRLQTMEKYRGRYLVVVEGSIPTAEGGIYCTVGGKTAVEILKETASGAAAVIAVGTCAAFGGLPAAAPNPTGAVGVRDIVKDKPVLNLPGCSVNAVNLAAAIAHFLTFGELPAADDLGRPLFAYGHLVHDNCPRRGYFDTGRFVEEWGDDGHRAGWCLYKMGCKGPRAHHNCPQVGWNEGTSWPVGAGHPCIACTEPGFWDTSTPFYRWMGEGFLPATTRSARPLPYLSAGLAAAGAAVAAGAGTAALKRQRKKAAETPAREGS